MRVSGRLCEIVLGSSRNQPLSDMLHVEVFRPCKMHARFHKLHCSPHFINFCRLTHSFSSFGPLSKTWGGRRVTELFTTPSFTTSYFVFNYCFMRQLFCSVVSRLEAFADLSYRLRDLAAKAAGYTQLSNRITALASIPTLESFLLKRRQQRYCLTIKPGER